MKKLALALVLVVTLVSQCALAEAEEPVTLSVLVCRNAAVNVPAEENEAWKYAAEQNGVVLEFTEIDSSAWNERFNVMLAGGDLPNIITKRAISSVVVKENIDAGLFVALNDYIDYMPNYMALLERNAGIKELAYYSDGTLGGFVTEGNFVTTETTITPTNLFMIYQPWLDALNLEMPETTEELYDVLVAFKTKDPNGNGEADEIPMSLLYGQSGLRCLGNFFALPFESSVNNCDIDENGNVYFLANTENYKEYLKYFNRLYEEGLLDSETFTQNQQQVLAKGTNEVPIIGSSAASNAMLVVGDDRAWDMLATPIIHSENTEPLWTRRVAGTAFSGVITSLRENVEKAVSFMDFFYSEEGARVAWMGIEGVSYEWLEDGTWDFIIPEGEDTTTIRARYTLQPGGGNASAYPEAWLSTANSSEQWFISQNSELALSNPEAFAERYPIIVYDDRTQSELDTIATDINSYVDQMMAEFIVGRTDIDAEWENYCTTLENMRLNDMLAIMQEGIDALEG